MSLRIKAPAKINLYLDIIGKRPDGFHDIRSVLLPISLHDTLSIEQRSKGIETVASRTNRFDGIPWPVELGNPEDNLATRAACLLKKASGYKGGARIVLKKRIPIAGGLGGGSSDAAAVLTGLNRLWKTGCTRDELMAFGDRLGCDIPALVHGGMVCMEGRGERLTVVERNPQCPLWLVLVNPGFGVSTGDIYNRYDSALTSSDPQRKFDEILTGLREGSLGKIAKGLYNALEKTVFRKYPLLETIRNVLEREGAIRALLTGTGATVFALAKDKSHAEDLAARVRRVMDCPLWCCVCEAVGDRKAERQ